MRGCVPAFTSLQNWMIFWHSCISRRSSSVRARLVRSESISKIDVDVRPIEYCAPRFEKFLIKAARKF